MRVGVCCGLEQAHFACDNGAEFLELPAFKLVTDPTAGDRLRGLCVEATNLFFGPEFRLYEDESRSVKVAERTIQRAVEFGIQVMVIGSGNARKSPSTHPPDWAFVHFVGIVGNANKTASECKIQLAPESLNREETDVGNDLAQLAESLRELGVGYTADSYHVLKEWDLNGREGGRELPSDELWRSQIPFAPSHVHLGPLARTNPTSDDPMLIGFFKHLKELGYDGRVSLEVNWNNFEAELKTGIQAARELWEAA